MNNKTKIILLAAILSTGSVAIFAGGQAVLAEGSKKNADSNTTIPLTESKLIIENNAKDKDTGFQGFIDSEEGWKSITVTGPDGKVLKFEGKGELGQLGLTELFFETSEPENADVPIDELLKTLPEGNYEFKGPTAQSAEEKGTLVGTAFLSHDIPEAPAILSPTEDAVVPEDEDLLVSWSSVDKNLDGSDAKINAFQLIIEKEQEPDPHRIGSFGVSFILPPSVTQMTIPAEFLEPGTDYSMEVLAIEDNGNQTINLITFSTSD